MQLQNLHAYFVIGGQGARPLPGDLGAGSPQARVDRDVARFDWKPQLAESVR